MKKYTLLILILISICLNGCIFKSEPMTEEERIECERKYREWEKSRYHEYKVVSVNQYIVTKTNRFGGIIEQEPKYCFTYIDKKGKLHQVDDFKHMEYGLCKVSVGKENKYVIKDRANTYRWLYLTEETLNN